MKNEMDYVNGSSMSDAIKFISNHQLKKMVLLITILILVLSSIGYWWQKKHYVSTDDAYINADIVQIAPRVTGQVTKLHVQNNQYVTENQTLFEIDVLPFELAAREAAAQLDASKAELSIAKLTSTRTLKLVKKHVASQQEGDTVEANLRSALAAIQLAEANLQKMKLNLSYTKISAPASGWVTNVTLHSGNIVQANQPLFALITDKMFWVDANFKETDIGKIKAHQKVQIIVDMYPKHPFEGVVESISGGSGNAFSLLPPQNATGNWVKVTQRVPVRIRILNPNGNYPLRIGTSANIKVRL